MGLAHFLFYVARIRNQAQAKHVFDFGRAYNEKIRYAAKQHIWRVSGRIFEYMV